MRVTLLGTGGPRPDSTRQGPATLVNASGLNLLFDAGRGVATQLAKADVRVEDLDAIFITHHHYDHIGGLGDLIMSAWNNGRARTLPIFGPYGTAEIIEGMFEHVYARDINFRIAEEWALDRPLEHPRALLEVHEVLSQTIDLEHGLSVVVDQVEHGSAALELPVAEWCSLGYRVNAEGVSVTISGDAVPDPGLLGLATRSDVLVMCAYLAADEITTSDDQFLVTKVLAGAPQAAAIAAEAGVGKLVLTHIREKTDEETEQMKSQVAATFDGEVIIASDLLSIDVT